MMRRQNGVDLESSGKIENFQERSFREKKKKEMQNQQLHATRNGLWEIERKNNGGRLKIIAYSLGM